MRARSGSTYVVNSRKYDGSIRRSWRCSLIERSRKHVELRGEFEEDIDHPELGVIDAGTVSLEKFYLDRWYNYFIFQNPSGEIRTYYINICLPPSVGQRVVDYIDLDIDLIIWPDGTVKELDLDEFDANALKYSYPEEVRGTALRTLEELRTALDGGVGMMRELFRF